MRKRTRKGADATYCETCSKVCDSSCRTASLHDRTMLARALMRTANPGSLR
jgi:hypothetical protein